MGSLNLMKDEINDDFQMTQQTYYMLITHLR